MSALCRLLAALAAVVALAVPARAQSAQPSLLWLHADLEDVQSDGYRLQNGVYEYEKIASAGDVSLYAAGYPAESGVQLLSPETDGGGLHYTRMDDVPLGDAQAARWRYEDAGSRWDYLRVETDALLMSIMIAVPLESADALDMQVEALISSLSLESAPQDAHKMLLADFEGFTTVMDYISGDGRMFACATQGDNALSVAITRGSADEAPFADIEDMRQMYATSSAQDAQRLEDVSVSGLTAERWRYTLALDEGETCRADAVLLCTEDMGYAAVFGLMGEITPEQESVLEHLIATLALE